MANPRGHTPACIPAEPLNPPAGHGGAREGQTMLAATHPPASPEDDDEFCPSIFNGGRRRNGLKKPIAMLVLLLPLGRGPGLAYYKLTTYHFAEVDPSVLYRGRQSLGPASLNHRCAGAHAKTVVCLIDDREMVDPRQAAVSGGDGVPWPGACERRANPRQAGRLADDSGRAAVPANCDRDKQNQPVLVHCAQGRPHATGMMAAGLSGIGSALRQRSRPRPELLAFGHSDNTTGGRGGNSLTCMIRKRKNLRR